MAQKKTPRAKKSPKGGLWNWARSNRRWTISFGTILALSAAYTTYVNTGADSLRTEIYQPLYREIGGMDTAIHANNLQTNYSSEAYQTLTRNGNLGRIPQSLRKEIIRLNEAEGEASSHLIPIAHKISVLMPDEIAKVRKETDDKIWTEKMVSQLNAEAKAELDKGSFPMMSFTFNHTGIGPALDLRDKAHPTIAAPGTTTWLVNDWMTFPKSASEIARAWPNTYYLGFDEKNESWYYRITHEDLSKNHVTLEEFLMPIYQVLAGDSDFQQLLHSSQAARGLLEEVKPSLADRVQQPKHLMDLID
jgi:hypothetical protein